MEMSIWEMRCARIFFGLSVGTRGKRALRSISICSWVLHRAASVLVLFPARAAWHRDLAPLLLQLLSCAMSRHIE